jgi:anti-sigma B factor antagonist
MSTSTTGFAAAVEHRDGTLVVALAGDLDLDTSPELERFLHALAPLPDVLALDLTELRFVDSSGMRTLLSEHGRALDARRRLVLIGVQGNVLSTMRLTGLDGVLPIAPALVL